MQMFGLAQAIPIESRKPVVEQLQFLDQIATDMLRLKIRWEQIEERGFLAGFEPPNHPGSQVHASPTYASILYLKSITSGMVDRGLETLPTMRCFMDLLNLGPGAVRAMRTYLSESRGFQVHKDVCSRFCSQKHAI